MSPESNAEACAMGTNPCHPDTDGNGWNEMDESRVYLDNETVRIRIRVYPKVSSRAVRSLTSMPTTVTIREPHMRFRLAGHGKSPGPTFCWATPSRRPAMRAVPRCASSTSGARTVPRLDGRERSQ